MTLFRSFILLAAAAGGALAQSWSADLGNRYWIQPDIVYNVANNYENKLDVI